MVLLTPKTGKKRGSPQGTPDSTASALYHVEYDESAYDESDESAQRIVIDDESDESVRVEVAEEEEKEPKGLVTFVTTAEELQAKAGEESCSPVILASTDGLGGYGERQRREASATTTTETLANVKDLDLYSEVTARAVEAALSEAPFSCELLTRFATGGVLSSKKWRSSFCVVRDGALLFFRTSVDFIDYVCNNLLDQAMRNALVERRVVLDKRVAASALKTKLYAGRGLLANFRISRDQLTVLKVAGPEHHVARLRNLLTLHAAADLDEQGGKGRPRVLHNDAASLEEGAAAA